MDASFQISAQTHPDDVTRSSIARFAPLKRMARAGFVPPRRSGSGFFVPRLDVPPAPPICSDDFGAASYISPPP